MTVDTPAWVRDAVFYQIFPDRFAGTPRVPKPGVLEAWDTPPTVHGFKGGDLLGIVEKLDYLQDLGVTAIYLTPIFQSASNHRYHTYDYFRVDPLLGGNEALRELLDVAHGLLKSIQNSDVFGSALASPIVNVPLLGFLNVGFHFHHSLFFTLHLCQQNFQVWNE